MAFTLSLYPESRLARTIELPWTCGGKLQDTTVNVGPLSMLMTAARVVPTHSMRYRHHPALRSENGPRTLAQEHLGEKSLMVPSPEAAVLWKYLQNNGVYRPADIFR